jgi:hypothetical protein
MGFPWFSPSWSWLATLFHFQLFYALKWSRHVNTHNVENGTVTSQQIIPSSDVTRHFPIPLLWMSLPLQVKRCQGCLLRVFRRVTRHFPIPLLSMSFADVWGNFFMATWTNGKAVHSTAGQVNQTAQPQIACSTHSTLTEFLHILTIQWYPMLFMFFQHLPIFQRCSSSMFLLGPLGPRSDASLEGGRATCCSAPGGKCTGSYTRRVAE